MDSHRQVSRVAVVGTGTIGASWATQFLARGLDVVATDPGLDAEARLRRFVTAAWDAVVAGGRAPGASVDRLTFTTDLRAALAAAEFVQESGPERPCFKVQLFAEMDEATPPDVIIASSSSGITMSVIQARCQHPERTVIGHPFNPPHLIPLVEVVGGAKTSPDAIRRTMSFYGAIGKRPIHVKKELPGHAANRLQQALYREIVYLIEQGVLDVAAADDAVSWGPGLRWGIMGPNLLWHLNGGEGGIESFIDTLMEPMAALWPGLGHPTLTPALKRTIAEGVREAAGGRSIDELARERDELLVEILAARARYATPPS